MFPPPPSYEDTMGVSGKDNLQPQPLPQPDRGKTTNVVVRVQGVPYGLTPKFGRQRTHMICPYCQLHIITATIGETSIFQNVILLI